MPTIVYLDADDEITSAASRIRMADDTRVGLVLPFGSRVATSRINFRLLAREAAANGRRLDIVAPDASARALAASAGLPVFASVGEYEAALDDDDAADETRVVPGPGASAAGMAAASTGLAAGAVPAAGQEPPVAGSQFDPMAASPARGGPAPMPGAVRRAPGTATPQARPDARPADVADHATGSGRRRRGPGRGLGLVLLLALLVLGAGAVAAVTVVPSADITLTPRIEAIGPISFTVVADPAATAVDPAAAVIPATTLQVPVSASGEFPATGRKVVKERATGTVRFTNCDPSSAYTLPSATVVRTRGGIGFTLDESVFLPVASISGTPPNIRVKCTTNDVAVRAADAGVGGNVDAGEIRVVPARYNRNLVRVTNPAATAGGSRQEFPRVKQEDVDAAIATLKADTHAELDAALQDPATVPAGRTAFPDTATLGALATDVDPATLVNQEVATFPLTMTGTGSVQAVDATPIQAIAQQRLEASLGEGDELVPGSVDVRVGEGSVVNGMVSFTVDGSAKQVRPLDAATIERQVLGLSRPEAERVLATYGDAIVALWPDYVTTVPTMESRVRFTLHDPVDRSPSEPTPSPRATTAPTRTTEPATDPGRSASPGAFPLPESPSDGAPSEPVPSG